jgi:bifunctional non-homologous end joining protein LigD
LPLSERRELMRSLLKFGSPRIRISDSVEPSAADMLDAVRQQSLEGIIAKRKDSFYEPGKRSGAWIKYRENRGQELVTLRLRLTNILRMADLMKCDPRFLL